MAETLCMIPEWDQTPFLLVVEVEKLVVAVVDMGNLGVVVNTEALDIVAVVDEPELCRECIELASLTGGEPQHWCFLLSFLQSYWWASLCCLVNLR